VQYKAPAAVEYEYSASASAPAAVEYEYSATASASAAPAALPDTGGSSLIALGAGVLLVAGGLLARRIVR
jgi:LPXTG-motif cell wall-anchored protein